MENFTIQELADFINAINRTDTADIHITVGEPNGGLVGAIADAVAGRGAAFDLKIKTKPEQKGE